MRLRVQHGRPAVALALLAPLLVPSGARASETEIVVEAARSAFTDVVIADDIFLSDVRFQVSTGGAYAGVIIEPHVRSSETAGNPTLIALRAPGLGQRPAVYATNGWIKPGTYRIWVFGDRRPRVVIPVSAGGFTIRPTQRVHVRLYSRASALTPGRSQFEHTYDRAVPPGWHALVGFRVTGDRLERTYACATTARTCPSPYGALPVVPSTGEQLSAGRVYSTAEARHAVVGVDGVRVGSGDLSSVVLSFAA